MSADEIHCIDDLFDYTISENTDDKCKGIFYKCKVNNFWNSKGHYVVSHRMVPMVRMSCKGCESCSFKLDDENKESLIETTDIEHDAIYELMVTNISYDNDYYCGRYCDSWDIEFVKVENTISTPPESETKDDLVDVR